MAIQILTEEYCQKEIDNADSDVSRSIWERVMYHVQRGELVTYDEETQRIHWRKDDVKQ